MHSELVPRSNASSTTNRPGDLSHPGAYEIMSVEWDMINSYQRLNVGAKLNNYETPKAFILMTANAIDSRYGDPDACLRTVRQYWKNTTAGLGREGEPVNPKIIESTTNKELKLPHYKRARKYAAISHLVYLASTVGLRLASVWQPKRPS